MNIKEFDYDLPKELIAQEPTRPCTHCKLMVLEEDRIFHKRFYEIIDYFRKGDVLVLNETKVIRAMVIGKRESGGKIELMLEGNSGYATVKGRLKEGNNIIFDKDINAIVLEKKENRVKLKFNIDILKVIDLIGELPVPPYVKKKLESESDYQNVFAKKDGSLACPTAGLHFDNDLLEKIIAKGVKIAKVCLHVSYDTFLPVVEENILDHKMHGEFCEVDVENAKVINSAKRIFVVGTTTVRALESLSIKGKILFGTCNTSIFIYPGYKFNLNYFGLITNFHLPKSTLLMMISAFFGKERIINAYYEAVKEKYHFFSLGDAMLLLK